MLDEDIRRGILMSDYYSREGQPQPQDSVEESYWKSLLNHGEFAPASPAHHEPQPGPTSAHPVTSAHLADDWAEARRIMAEDGVLSLVATGYNRGGLLVEWRSLRGFVPASQLVTHHIHDEPHLRRTLLTERIGHTLALRIIEIDPAKNRLILSERAAQVATGVRHRLLHDIQPGDVLEGRITNIVDFGAFADLGGVEGLIHISELSWGRVGHPADLLKRGQTVRVYVMEVDPSNTRVALSIKRLHPDPWATVEHRYRVGEIIEGQITNVVDFGAFACIEEGLEGLIHFSELAEGHFLHPRNVVQEGDTVRARILSIDGKARRLGLTLRLQ